MEAVEIVFAQRLACGDPTIRKRALKFLREHIKQESERNAFTDESLSRLCKGLHYALWMQDKMLLQEELADDICILTELLQNDQQVIEFARALITVLSKEWPCIDRWRMDKFLMFIRRLVRTLFTRLSIKQWDKALVDAYLQMFSETLISSQSNICESLKLHCVSIWLDELDVAANKEQGFDVHKSLHLLQPYIKLLSDDISDTFFRSICTDIFDAILHDFSEQLAEQKIQKFFATRNEARDGEKSLPETEQLAQKQTLQSNNLVFDYTKLAQLLFEVGKQPSLQSKRRKRLYSLSKKFENAAKNVDPMPPLAMPLGDVRVNAKRRKKH